MGLFRRSRPAAEPTGSVPAAAIPPPAEPPSGGADTVGSTDPVGGAVDHGPAAWETLAPLTPTVTAPTSTFKIGDAVKDDLVALDSPRLTRGMGHLISDDGPPGVVSGLATIGVQRQAIAAADAPAPAPAPAPGNGTQPAPPVGDLPDMPLPSPPRPEEGADHLGGVDADRGPGTVLVPRILGVDETNPTVSRLVDAHPVDPPARHLPLVSPVVQHRHDGNGSTAPPPGPTTPTPAPEPAPASAPGGPTALAHDDGPASGAALDALGGGTGLDASVPATLDPPAIDDAGSGTADLPGPRPRPGALGPPIVAGGDGAPLAVQRTGDGDTPVGPQARTGARPAAAPDTTVASPTGSPPPEMPIVQRTRAGHRPRGGVGLGEPMTVARTPGGVGAFPPSGVTGPSAPAGEATSSPSASAPTGGLGPGATGTPGGEMPLVQRSADDAGTPATGDDPGLDGSAGSSGTAGRPDTTGALASAEPPAPAGDAANPPADDEAVAATVRPTLGLDDPLTAGAEPGGAAPASDSVGDIPSGGEAPPLPLAAVQRQAAVDGPGTLDTSDTSGTPAATGGDAAAAIGLVGGAGDALAPAPDLATAVVPGPGSAPRPPAAAATLPLVAQRSLAAAPTLASALAVRADSNGRAPDRAAGNGVAVPVPTWPAPTGRSTSSGRPVVQRWPSLGSVADAARDRGQDLVESGIDSAGDRVSDAASRLPGTGDLPALDLPNAPEMPSAPDLPGLGNVPGLPALPAVPGMPTMPSLPGMPPAPSMPSMPAMPAMPSMPSLPSMPLAMPSLPSTPSVPSVPDMPSVPSMSSMPQVPGAGAVAEAAGVPMTEISFPAAGAAAAAAAGGASAAPAAGPADGGGAGAPGGGAAGGDLDELAHKLYDRIRWRLRTELRLDRERAGLGAGVRH